MWSEMVAGKVKIIGPHEVDYHGYSHYCLNSAISIPSSFKPYFGRTFTLGMMNSMLDLTGRLNSKG